MDGRRRGWANRALVTEGRMAGGGRPHGCTVGARFVSRASGSVFTFSSVRSTAVRPLQWAATTGTVSPMTCHNYIVMAYAVMACIAMAYAAMAYIVTAAPVGSNDRPGVADRLCNMATRAVWQPVQHGGTMR